MNIPQDDSQDSDKFLSIVHSLLMELLNKASRLDITHVDAVGKMLSNTSKSLKHIKENMEIVGNGNSNMNLEIHFMENFDLEEYDEPIAAEKRIEVKKPEEDPNGIHDSELSDKSNQILREMTLDTNFGPKAPIMENITDQRIQIMPIPQAVENLRVPYLGIILQVDAIFMFGGCKKCTKPITSCKSCKDKKGIACVLRVGLPSEHILTIRLWSSQIAGLLNLKIPQVIAIERENPGRIKKKIYELYMGRFMLIHCRYSKYEGALNISAQKISFVPLQRVLELIEFSKHSR